MIIPKKSLIEYLLNSDSYLEEITSQKTLQKLKAYESRIHQPPFSITDNLFLEHQDSNKSLRAIAEYIGIASPTLSKIFYYYNLPIKTQAEAVRENWKDEEFRKRNAEAVRENWKDEEFRKRQAEATRENWKDEEFRKRNAEATREMLDKRWKDEEFRKRQTEATREARKSKIPKVRGYRSDIQRNTSTTAEANFARIIKYCERKEVTDKIYEIHVPEKLRDVLKTENTKLTLDFLTLNSQGKLKAYLILPRPQQKSYIKADLLKEQYNIRLSIITEEKYHRLERWFKRKINTSPNLAGWETSEDNIETNPKKYNPTNKEYKRPKN